MNYYGTSIVTFNELSSILGSSFGLVPGSQLQVAVLQPKQSLDVSLLIVPGGGVLKMQPVSLLQIAVKNNIDVFYFGAVMPMNVLFAIDGKMGAYA